MGYLDANPYYSPEKMGLELIGVAEDDAPYEFDMLVAWYHPETNGVYAAADAGCSCPTPFEDYTTIERLTPINHVSDLTAMASMRIPRGDLDRLKRKVRRKLSWIASQPK